MLKSRSTKILFILGLLTEIIYLLFYSIEPLRKYLGDSSLTLRNNYLFLLVVGLLLLALIFYILSYKQIIENKINLKIIVAFFIVFNLTLLFVWPIGSTDIFNYIYQSRVLSEHQANPYLASYDTFVNDKFYHIIKNQWSINTVNYGPIWVIMGSILSFIGGNSLLLTLFFFKLFFVLINFLSLYLIYKISNSVKTVFLYAWNPLILYEFALNGHNDVLIIFFTLLSLFYFLQQNKIKNHILSWVFLLLSILTKFYTIIFLPIFFLISLFKIKEKREKLFFSLITILTFIIIPIIFFLPFWNGIETFSGIKTQLSASSMIFTSPAILMFSSLLYSFHINNYFNLAQIIGKTIFIIFYCFVIIKLFLNHFIHNKLNKNDILKYSFFIYFIFLITAVSWLMPWYFILLITLLILNFKNFSSFLFFKNTTILYSITLYGILYYIILR